MDVNKLMEIRQPSAEPPQDIPATGKGLKGNKSKWDEKKENIVKEARRMVSLMLEAMEEDTETPSTRDSGLTFSKNSLKAFTASETISVERFRNSGGLRSIAIAIRKYCHLSDVVHYGCNSLAAFTMHESTTIKELIKVGAIESVVAAIEGQAESGTDDACVSALKVLRNLTQTEENRAMIWKASGLEAVCKAMAHHGDCGRTLSHAALVISNLTFGNSEMKDDVGRLGGLAAIAKGMRDHKDYQAMQARGSLALRNLCFQSDYNQGVADQAGVADALISAIHSYMDDREVVHQCCVALANISNVSAGNREKIVAAGGGAILVSLMKMYPDSTSANDDALSIIRNIAVGNSEAQLEIGLNGGVGCICHALEKFQKNKKIVDKACTAIRYLCFLAENRARVKDCRGIESIIAALKANMSSLDIVENALLAIGNATFESDENKGIVGRCGGIGAIIDAVETHRRSVAIQEHGCRVLRNLSDGFELNRGLQAENGAIKTGVFAMLGYPENASVQEQASAMLLNISLNVAHIELLRQVEVERLAEKALSLHPKHRGVQLQAGSLLDRMNGYDVGGSKNAVEGAGEVERVERQASSTRLGGLLPKVSISKLLPGRSTRE